MVGQLVAVSNTASQVARFLTELFESRSKPQKIVCDSGTEFTSKSMFFWSQKSGVNIQLGKASLKRLCGES